MREIDDRYPEYARPYEPLRGGRHRRLKRQNMLRKYYNTGAAALIVIVILVLLTPKPAPPTPPVLTPIPTLTPTHTPTPVPTSTPTPTPTPASTPTPVPTPTPTPVPTLTPTPVPTPTPTPVPTPTPTPVPTPTPTPVPTPTPTPVPTPTPTPVPTPTPTPVPTPTPTPVPTPTPTPKPTPVPTPAPTPVPKTRPSVELSPYVDGPYVEGAPYPTLQFSMVLNDVKGGQVTATIYVDTGSGFYHPSNEYSSGTTEYDPSVTTDNVWIDYMECPIDPPSGGGIAGKAKIVFDYVYPDGETGRIETAALPVHNGTYVRTNEAYEWGGYYADSYVEEETGELIFAMSFEVIIDRSLVVPSAVTPYHELWLSDPWTYYQDPTIELYTDGNGNCIMHFTYYSDTGFPEGNYWFAPQFSYQEDACNGWSIDDYGLNFYYYPPI